MITQYSREAVICDRVIVLNEGKVVADDTPKKIFAENQLLLNQIGIEIPIEFKLKSSIPGFDIDPGIFEFSSAHSGQ